MKYFQLLYDFEHDHDYAFAAEGDLKGVYRYDVNRGKPVLEWPDGVYFKYDLKYGTTWTDYLANIYHWPMFSERMRELAEAIIPEGDIQIYYFINKDRKRPFFPEPSTKINLEDEGKSTQEK